MPGSIIRTLRENRGLKQEEVARQMGISQSAYSKIENAQTEVTVKHCKILSRIFGVNVYDFFPDDFEITRHRQGDEELEPGETEV